MKKRRKIQKDKDKTAPIPRFRMLNELKRTYGVPHARAQKILGKKGRGGNYTREKIIFGLQVKKWPSSFHNCQNQVNETYLPTRMVNQ